MLPSAGRPLTMYLAVGVLGGGASFVLYAPFIYRMSQVIDIHVMLVPTDVRSIKIAKCE